MKESRKNPILFIPGLMGSLGGDMIAGTGPWTFGVARLIYHPFIKGLEDMGYRRNENLFICFYDWRMGAEDIVEAYFKPCLKEIRKKHPHQSIDVICHSMGGIIARRYIQMEGQAGEIQRLIMMGTPNKGAIDAYYFWSTGKLYKKSSLYSYIYRGYIWILSKLLKIPLGTENIHELHMAFQGMECLLPSREFGDFLFYEDHDNSLRSVPWKTIKYNNPYLSQLNQDLKQLFNNVTEVYTISGVDFETKEGFILDKKMLSANEEYIIDSIKTPAGDGTVTLKSSEIKGSKQISIHSSHHRIVKDSLKEIGAIYGVEMETDKNDFTTLHIIFKGNLDFTIDTEEGFIIDYSRDKIITSLDYLQQFHRDNYTWLTIINLPQGEYSLKLKSLKLDSCNLFILGDGMEELEESLGPIVGYSDFRRIITFKIEG